MRKDLYTFINKFAYYCVMKNYGLAKCMVNKKITLK